MADRDTANLLISRALAAPARTRQRSDAIGELLELLLDGADLANWVARRWKGYPDWRDRRDELVQVECAAIAEYLTVRVTMPVQNPIGVLCSVAKSAVARHLDLGAGQPFTGMRGLASRGERFQTVREAMRERDGAEPTPAAVIAEANATITQKEVKEGRRLRPDEAAYYLNGGTVHTVHIDPSEPGALLPGIRAGADPAAQAHARLNADTAMRAITDAILDEYPDETGLAWYAITASRHARGGSADTADIDEEAGVGAATGARYRDIIAGHPGLSALISTGQSGPAILAEAAGDANPHLLGIIRFARHAVREAFDASPHDVGILSYLRDWAASAAETGQRPTPGSLAVGARTLTKPGGATTAARPQPPSEPGPGTSLYRRYNTILTRIIDRVAQTLGEEDRISA